MKQIAMMLILAFFPFIFADMPREFISSECVDDGKVCQIKDRKKFDEERNLWGEIHLKFCTQNDLETCDLALQIFSDLKTTVKKPYKQSIKLSDHLKACSSRYMEACYTAAVLLSSGERGFPDREKSSELFEFACKKGHIESCRKLSNAYYVGLGTEKNIEKSRYYDEYIEKIRQIRKEVEEIIKLNR
jgi:TPR repeat protein